MLSRVWLLSSLLLVSVWASTSTGMELRNSKLQSLWEDKENERVVHVEKTEVLKQVAAIRARRQTTSGPPVVHGDFQFSESDRHRYAQIYYFGDNSSVILVLTYNLTDSITVADSNLYRSSNYGANFELIDSRLDSSTAAGPVLWYNFHIGNVDKNLLVFPHASQKKLFYSQDEGLTWQTQTFSVQNIDPRTFTWNSRRDQWALAHDVDNSVLYLTQNIGQSWIRLASNVEFPFDYQWANPKYYEETTVFYNTFDPADRERGNFTVGLYYQSSPYNNAKEVDPKLGQHDAFLMVGPYIFAQKTVNDVVGLYISYKKSPFHKAMIPSNDPHQNYYVAHIDELQALVVVEHESGQNNLYLSDEKGVYFSLSLPDLVVETSGIDLEVINGVNGTLIANQYVRASPTEPANTKRTLITLDNGGNWELVVPPDRDSNGNIVDCDPPQCSLHLHMDSTAYARLGVYSRSNAPGLIIAHGTVGSQLSGSPDLYLSRDGGVTWEETLKSSWGVTVADHGGLLVAARDYHQEPSTLLMYSCSEGQTWSGFTFSNENMTVYGVITEPGEYTTTVSLYGVKVSSARVWDVVTVNFSSIFARSCGSNDFYDWQPWDERTDTDCILGADVSIERRLSSVCCLIGTGYVRNTLVTTCACTEEDYDCDYGFMHSDGFVGPCIRDTSIQLDDPCQSGQVTSYNKSTGYRKIPGDICKNGLETRFEPQPFSCCDAPTGQPTKKPTETPTLPVTTGAPVTAGVPALGNKYSVTVPALGVLLALAVLVAVVLGVLTATFALKHSKARRQYLRLATSGDSIGRGGISYVRDSDTRVLLGSGVHGADSDGSDEEPLEP